MNRRGFLIGLGAALATPVIVRASSLMPVRTPITMRPQPATDLVFHVGPERYLKTLQQAYDWVNANCMHDNVTLAIDKGVYQGISLEAGKRIMFRGSSEGETVITSSGRSQPCITAKRGFLDLEGCTLRPDPTAPAALWIMNGVQCVITDNRIVMPNHLETTSPLAILSQNEHAGRPNPETWAGPAWNRHRHPRAPTAVSAR